MKVEKKAFAKINLSIHVLGKREDNYHELDMILQTVDLYDSITIEKTNNGIISLECDDKSLPTDIKNDAYKAAKLMKDYYDLKSGYDIKIQKNIPIEAGLGGGSSDAACVINSIIELENLNINQDELDKLSLKIGAEMPYSLRGGIKRVKGIGDVVLDLDLKHDYYFTIVKPNLAVKTKDIFTKYNAPYKSAEELKNIKCKNDDFIANLKEKNFDIALNYMHNDLEKVTFELHPELNSIKNKLLELGAKTSLMSGSGSSIYGVFYDFKQAKTAEEYFIKNGLRAFAVKTI